MDNKTFLTKTMPVRLVIISVIVLLLSLPLFLVGNVVSERKYAYEAVLAEISEQWGQEQVIVGPVLTVPFTETWVETESIKNSNGNQELRNVTRKINSEAVLLPKSFSSNSILNPEFRQRGIYNSLVYLASININAQFTNIESRIKQLSDPQKTLSIEWDKISVSFGISDPKGIAKTNPLLVENQQLSLEPGTNLQNFLPNGFHSKLKIKPSDSFNVSLSLDLKGSNGLKIAPIGETNDIQMSSTWAHPSFYGDLLPTSRKVNDSGFEAKWTATHLVRSYPQLFLKGSNNNLSIAMFSTGVRLFEPVTLYTEATRAVKYGFLFIALTFLAMALIEIVSGVRPSFIQYFMIGIALAMFYLLLIALAEHIGFNRAYTVAGITVILMISSYCLTVLNRKRLTFITSTVLVALYAILFTILRAEDYALLAGSILLTSALAITMFFTRNIHKQTE